MSIHCIEFLEKIFALFVLFLLTETIFIEYSSNAAPVEAINEFQLDDIVRGTYNFRYITPEGTVRNENGYLDNEGNLVVFGFYSYTDPDGKEQYVSYRADKDGYRTLKVPEFPTESERFDSNAVASLLG